MKTIVIAIRHGEHGEEGKPKNALIDSARVEAEGSGKKLAELGYKVDVAFSSPQFRAIETLQCVLIGTGKLVPLSVVDAQLGDLGMDPMFGEEVKNKLKADAKAANIEVEEFFVKSPDCRAACIRRGKEGADAILEMVKKFPGKTLAFASHGGSRMEISQATLQGKDVQQPDFFFIRGGIAIYTFEDAKLESVEYLGNLATGQK